MSPGFFSGIFAKKDQSVLGIDVGSSSIKVVQLRKKGSIAVLETYGELALGPYGESGVGQATKLPTLKLIEAMKDLLNEKEVGLSTRNCGMAIPFSASLLRVIEMPNVKEKELEGMVPIEARKYIPVPISEVTLDWSVVPQLSFQSGQVEVADELKSRGENLVPKKIDILLAAIHNNVIDEYSQIVEATGLSASFFEIELFSSMRSVLDESSKSAMILDMGAASTKLYIVERGIMRNSHIINKGAQDITSNIARTNSISFEEAEVVKRNFGLEKGVSDIDVSGSVQAIAEYIFSEANRVLFTYQNEQNKNIDEVILIGGGSALKGWTALAAENFKIPTVAGDPFSKVEAPAFLEKILKETGPEFAVSVGVALRKLKEM
ncbi:MAG TPA: type IV pilus assembly protein PilM [Candidatus Paceibacterota bacterium]